MPGTSTALPQLPFVSLDHERLGVAGAVLVVAAGGAVAGRGTRDRVHAGFAAAVEGGGAGNFDRVAPAAVRLADHERLVVAGAVG